MALIRPSAWKAKALVKAPLYPTYPPPKRVYQQTFATNLMRIVNDRVLSLLLILVREIEVNPVPTSGYTLR